MPHATPFPAPLPQGLTLAQKRLWTLNQIGTDRLLGDHSLALHLDGPLSEAEILAAVDAVAGRHPALRTAFTVLPGGRVDSLWRPETPLPAVVHAAATGPEALRAALEADAERLFDLPTEGPLRLRLVRPARASGVVLVLTLHAVVCDGASLPLLAEDLAAALAGFPLPSAAPPPDAAAEERAWLQSPEAERALDHWRAFLAEAPAAAVLPWRAVAPAAPTGTRARRSLLLGDTLDAAVHALADDLTVPVDSVLAAAFAVLVGRYGGPWRGLFGWVDDRRAAFDPGRVGRLETPLPVAVALDADQGFAAVVRAMDHARRVARAHTMPFERLVQDQDLEPDAAAPLSLDALVQHQRAPRWAAAVDALAARGITLRLVEAGLPRADAALVLTTREIAPGRLAAVLDGCADRHEPWMIAQAAEHWRRLLAAGCAAPDTSVGDLPLLTAADLSALSAPYPDTVPRDGTLVHRRITARAVAHPDRVAILCGTAQTTFGALEALANRIAHALAPLGVSGGGRVAVLIKRSPQAVAAILGVLKAGGAFVPVDPDHPDRRNHHVLTDAGVAAVLTLDANRERMPPGMESVPVLAVDALPPGLPSTDPGVAVADDQLAYVMYTSGSTGAPKGVAVAHGPLARHLDATARAYRMDEHSRELPVLPFSSDGGHERWMVPLMLGGSIVLPEEALLAPDEALALMRRHGVTNASLPTAYVHQMAEWADLSGPPPHARLYSFGGEALAPTTFALIGRALPADFLINGYGPTETIMTPMVWRVAPGAAIDGLHAPIGRPVGLRRAYVLDGRRQPLPPGVPGELYLGGDGVACGYHGRPDLTAERFIPDPFAATIGAAERSPGHSTGVLYRTGDLARWHPDGMIDFLGRADLQIKLRGFRIEPGEIESVLKRQPAVREAAVILREDGGQPALVAYIIAAEGVAPDPLAIRAEAARALPDHMVPAAVVVVERIPLTATGKLDRNALPAPRLAVRDLEPPATPLETLVAEVWREVLGLEALGVTESYFQLGGTSIAGLAIMARLKRRLPGIVVTIADLFNHPTVRALAAFLERGESSDGEVITLRAGGSRPMLYCFPGLLVSTREYLKLLDYLGPDQPATGFVCYTLAEQGKADASIPTIAARYADHIRRRSAGQPVVFLGWSWGGMLAYETARLLGDAVDVRLIGMVDVCDMDTDFALGAVPRFAPGERDAVQARVQDWLGKTRMRAEWDSVLGAMDALAYDQFLAFVRNAEQDLPLDGPAVGSREHIFWVLIDNALVFRRHTLLPHDVPIQSFAAEDSLHRGLNLIDWRRLSPRAQPAEIIAGTNHLHIIGMTAFHSRFAQRLEACLPPPRQQAAE